jgi:type IV secretory pathway VirB3-like protein
LFRKVIDKEERSICDEQNKVTIEIEAFNGILVVLIFTFTIGLIILIIEIFLFKYLNNKNIKTNEFKKFLFCFNNIKKHQLSNNVIHISK